MSRPRVTVHLMTSVDGRTDHFAGDEGLYYEIAARIPQDAVLSGSATFVGGARMQGVDLEGEDALPADCVAPEFSGSPETPLLVLVDSRGQLTRFDWLRAIPYWRGLLVACSASTPAAHLELLDRHRVEYVVVGEDRVDLGALLETLADRGVADVRVDSGGVLNGALLRAGLVDEISLILAPYAVGGRTPASLFVADDLAGDVSRLELLAVERLRGDMVWLRYGVPRSP